MKSHVYEQLFTDANARLKAAKICVTIRRRGDALYLRATFPPKPGSRRVKLGQYDLLEKRTTKSYGTTTVGISKLIMHAF